MSLSARELLERRKEEVRRKIGGQGGMTLRHRDAAVDAGKNARSVDDLHRMEDAILRLAHRNAKEALDRGITPSAAAELRSDELDNLLGLIERLNNAATPAFM